jgi:hypothetical protein
MGLGAAMQIIGGIIILFSLLGIADLLTGDATEPPRHAPRRHAPSQYICTDQDWADGPLRKE